jgi:MFS family permease
MHPSPLPSARPAIRTTLIEAATVGGMLAATDLWMVPLLKQGLGASDGVIGLISVLPMAGLIVLGLAVRPLVDLMGGNLRTMVASYAVQAVCLLLLSVPVHFPDRAWSIPFAATLVTVSAVLTSLAGGVWNAWIGSLVPMGVRGRYIAGRTRLANGCRLAVIGLFAVLMSQLPAHSGPWGLQIVLLVAAGCRGWGAWLQWQAGRHPERTPLPQAERPSNRLAAQQGYLGFLATLHRTYFGRWTLVWCAACSSMMVAGPFFAPYMIAPVEKGGLGLTAVWYSLLMVVNPVVKLITYPAAGRLIEHRGAASVLRAGTALSLFIPLGWILSTNYWVLVCFEVVSGVAWALLECGVNVLISSCHPDQRVRARLIGYHQTVFGVFTLIGTGLGTLLVTLDLPPLWGSQYHTVFFASMVLRLPAVLLACFMLPSLRRPDLPHRQLLILVPGFVPIWQLGRSLTAFFRRPDGE